MGGGGRSKPCFALAKMEGGKVFSHAEVGRGWGVAKDFHFFQGE